MFCNFFLNLNDYNFISQPRLLKMGGGVGMYVDTDFKYTIRNYLIVRTEPHVYDSLLIETTVQNFNTIIGVIYKPPN